MNYFGYVRMIRAVSPHMRARNSGIVHNVSSGVGRVGNPGLTGYASTKGAIESLARSLRHELRRENVVCTIVHLRPVKTRSVAALGYPESQMADPEYVGRKLAEKIERTDRVIYADRVTKIGLSLAQLFRLSFGTERFIEDHEAARETEQ